MRYTSAEGSRKQAPSWKASRPAWHSPPARQVSRQRRAWGPAALSPFLPAGAAAAQAKEHTAGRQAGRTVRHSLCKPARRGMQEAAAPPWPLPSRAHTWHVRPGRGAEAVVDDRGDGEVEEVDKDMEGKAHLDAKAQHHDLGERGALQHGNCARRAGGREGESAGSGSAAEGQQPGSREQGAFRACRRPGADICCNHLAGLPLLSLAGAPPCTALPSSAAGLPAPRPLPSPSPVLL